MDKRLIELSKKIAKTKPLEDGCPNDHIDESTGLPLELAPFYVTRSRLDGGPPTDEWRVMVTNRSHYGASVLFDNIPNVFRAYRLMIDCLEAWQIIKPVEQVYFIGTKLENGQLIKVGHSRNVEARLKALQTSHGERLNIFATVKGGKDLEAKYHRRWKHRRREGEWFTVGDCITAEIERLSPHPTTTAGGE